MCIVVSPPPAANARARFVPVPWHDDHPDRLALDRPLACDHLARQIDAAVDRLDLGPLYDRYGGTGSPAYGPALLLRVVLYETRNGRHSPAAWHRAAAEDGPVRWLLRGYRPSRSVWYAFRDRLGPALDELNRQVLAQAQAAGLTPAERGAGDGTPVAASASRHQLLNQERLQQRSGQLAEAVADDQAGRPPAAVPGWMAKTAAGRRAQHERLDQAREELDRRRGRNRAKRAGKRQADDKVVISPSEPEAALGRDKDGVYRPLYNVQLIDDLDSPFVLGYAVFAQPNDAGLVGPLLARAQAALGHPLRALLLDSAYTGGADLAAAAEAGVTLYAALPEEGAANGKYLPKGDFAWLPAEQTYTCPQGHRLSYEGSCRHKRSGTDAVLLHRYRCPPAHCTACPLQQRCTPNPQAGRTVHRAEHDDLVEALRRRMAGTPAKALYRLRRQTVELVNADWKQHRRLRRFSGRGLARAWYQVGQMVLTHNLLTLLSEEKKAKTAHAVNPHRAGP
jgi:transposase